MDRVNIQEARRRLSKLVDDAERGESVVITRHGKKVARIEPVRKAGGRTLPDLSKFRQSIKAGGKGLSRTVIERRRRNRH